MIDITDIESLVNMNDFKIEKVGYYLPKNIVTNDDLSQIMDTNDEWIHKRTGIKSRYIAEESLREMVKNAIENLKLSEVEQQAIDLIIVASSSDKVIMPSLSSFAQGQINSNKQIVCLDLNAACSGFVHSLIVANQFFNAKNSKAALIIGAEKMSNIIEPTDRNTAILFGDGVGAFYLTASENHTLAYESTTNYDNTAIYATADGMDMNGQQVFKYAVKTVISTIKNLLDSSKLSINEVDYIVCHQANQRILNTIIREYKLKSEQVLSTIEWSANTSSASIPITFATEIKELVKGQKVMFIGFGAGLTSSGYLYQE